MSTLRYDVDSPSAFLVDRSTTRLLYVSTAKYGGDWHSLPHTHGNVELFYVLGGRGQFCIGDTLLPVQADDLVIVNPNVPHTEVSLNASPLEYIVLGVEGLEFQPSEDQDGRYSIVSLHAIQEEIVPFLRGMLREIETKPAGYQTICQDLLEVLVVRLWRHTENALLAAPQQKRSSSECAAVYRYIDRYFKENITLAELAEMAHMNKYYLVHIFKKEHGISPIRYLIERRIQESCYLLAETDHSMSQISHLLGFSSPSYFSQSFRKQEGCSPQEYRRSSRAKAAKTGPLANGL